MVLQKSLQKNATQQLKLTQGIEEVGYLDTSNCCKDEIILWCFPIGQILLIGWNLGLLNWTVGKSYTPQSKSCHSLNDFSPFCNLLEEGTTLSQYYTPNNYQSLTLHHGQLLDQDTLFKKSAQSLEIWQSLGLSQTLNPKPVLHFLVWQACR